MSDNNRPLRPDVPNYVEEALKELVAYLWDDELKHFRALDSNFEGHIFTQLATVRRWLEGDEQ